MRKYLLATVPILFGAMFDIAIAVDGDTDAGAEAAFVLGVLYGQMTVIAAGTVLFPARASWRIAVGSYLAMLVSLAAAFAFRITGIGLLIGAGLLVQWVGVQIPLWIGRRRFGLQLVSSTAARPRNDTQFGIRHLLASVAVVAVTLGVLRQAMPSLEPQRIGQLFRLFFTMHLLAAAFAMLMAWPTILAGLAAERLPLWMCLAIGCCVVVSVLERATFESMLGPQTTDVFWWVNGVQLITAATSLLMVRLCGLRLAFATPERAHSLDDEGVL